MENAYLKTIAFNSQMEYIAEVCKQLEEKETKELIKSDSMIVTFDNIKDYLDSQSKSFKRFVAFDYPDKVVIMRIIDNSDTKTIYKFMYSENKKTALDYDSQKQYEKIIELNEKYLNSTLEKVQKMDGVITSKMFVDNVIPYGWLQRNTSSSAIFKNTGNATKALQSILWAMIEKGEAKQIPDGVEKYGTAAKLYLIGKNKTNSICVNQPTRPNKLGSQKESELAYITQEIEKLEPLKGLLELQIYDDIAVTYHDIRRHLNDLSQGQKRYGVTMDKEKTFFYISRQFDDYDMSIFYKHADLEAEQANDKPKHKDITPTQPEPAPADPAPNGIDMQELDNMPARKDAHPGFQLAEDYMRSNGQL